MSKCGTVAVCAAKRIREENGLCPISARKSILVDIQFQMIAPPIGQVGQTVDEPADSDACRPPWSE